MNTIPKISAIILTYNEEKHIARCIDNIKQVAQEVFVVDCFSNDQTCSIASKHGAIIIEHEYINQAQQFQWALDNLKCTGEWVLRMDADEYLTDGLISEIKKCLPTLSKDTSGCNLSLDVIFLGKNVKHGRISPPKILRLWRNGAVYMEQRWMDEKCVLKYGKAITLKGRFIDHNLNGISWWIQKHNNYSNREIVVELGKKYGLINEVQDKKIEKRNIKKRRYYLLPMFFRAFVYFFIRYICLLGFLDGRQGLIWATLQAYWYRFLIDSKIYEFYSILGKNPNKELVKAYFQKYYNIKI